MYLDASPAKERLFLAIGAVSGFVAVALGAFGAHGLRDVLTPDRLEIFETGVRYQMFHAVALLATGLVITRRSGRAAPMAGWLFALGTLVFSGSLYVLALSGVRWWGAITPIGGVAWLLAWALLAVSASRSRVLVAEVEGDEVVDVSPD